MLACVPIGFAIKEEIAAAKRKPSREQLKAAPAAARPPSAPHGKAPVATTTTTTTTAAPPAPAAKPKTQARPKSSPPPRSAPSRRAPPAPSHPQPSAVPVRRPAGQAAVVRKPVAANSLTAAKRAAAGAAAVWNFDLRPPDRDLLLIDQDKDLALLKLDRAAALSRAARGDDDVADVPVVVPSRSRGGRCASSGSGMPSALPTSPRSRPAVGNTGTRNIPAAAPPLQPAPATAPAPSSTGPRWCVGTVPETVEFSRDFRAVPGRNAADLRVPLREQAALAQALAGAGAGGEAAGGGEVVRVLKANALQ